MAVEYREIIVDNAKNYLDFYLKNRKRLPISLDVRLLLSDLGDQTPHPNSLVAHKIATLMIQHLEKSELTEDDLPLKWFIDLIEDYKQGRITMRVALIRFLIELEQYGDAIKNRAISQKIDNVHRRRDFESLIEVQKEEMARKRDAVEYLALERKQAQLQQIPKNRRGKDDDTLERLDFGLPLHKQKVKAKEIGKRWLIKVGQLTDDGWEATEGNKIRKLTKGELNEKLKDEGAYFRQIFSRYRQKQKQV